MPELDDRTREDIKKRLDRRREIEESMPRYVQLNCRLCSWASNGLNLNMAREENERHERDHQEYEEWTSLTVPREQIVAAIHDHKCKLEDCQCRCGCQEGPFCTLVFGDLCSTCNSRDIRNDPEHGPRDHEREEEVNNQD